jgi:dTDP-4-amino-4,6-dideoxygalactose transaminase
MEKALECMRPAERLPKARRLGDNSLMFLVHPTLSDGEMIDTAAAVSKVMAGAVS